MNPHLQKLQAYPFEKLSKLINNERPSDQYSAVSLAIGEPKHPTPESIKNALASKLSQLDKYPSTRGSDELRFDHLEVSLGHHILPDSILNRRSNSFARCNSATDRCPVWCKDSAEHIK